MTNWLSFPCTFATCVSRVAGALAFERAHTFVLAAWKPFGVALGTLPMSDVGNLTATAILGWYAWHTASRTIPQLIKDFREELAAHRELYREEVNALRSEMVIERERRHADQMCIVSALQDLGCRFSPEAGGAEISPPTCPDVTEEKGAAPFPQV